MRDQSISPCPAESLRSLRGSGRQGGGLPGPGRGVTWADVARVPRDVTWADVAWVPRDVTWADVAWTGHGPSFEDARTALVSDTASVT